MASRDSFTESTEEPKYKSPSGGCKHVSPKLKARSQKVKPRVVSRVIEDQTLKARYSQGVKSCRHPAMKKVQD